MLKPHSTVGSAYQAHFIDCFFHSLHLNGNLNSYYRNFISSLKIFYIFVVFFLRKMFIKFTTNTTKLNKIASLLSLLVRRSSLWQWHTDLYLRICDPNPSNSSTFLKPFSVTAGRKFSPMNAHNFSTNNTIIISLMRYMYIYIYIYIYIYDIFVHNKIHIDKIKSNKAVIVTEAENFYVYLQTTNDLQ